ncbi:hypothetical protein Tco_1516444 [Tanacetum coccineum]
MALSIMKDDKGKGKVNDKGKRKIDDKGKGKMDDKWKGKVDVDKGKRKIDDQGKGKTKLMVFEKTKEAKHTQLKVKEAKEAELKVKKEVIEVSHDEEDSRDLVFLVMKICVCGMVAIEVAKAKNHHTLRSKYPLTEAEIRMFKKKPTALIASTSIEQGSHCIHF